MKTKVKKLGLVALALCAVCVTAVAVTACGGTSEQEEPVDYTTFTYSDWHALTDADWDKKTISYQIDTGRCTAQISGTEYELLFNLYEDGTLLVYQAGLYTTGASDQVWADQARHITWDYFGFWEATNSGIDLYYMCSMADSSLTVQKTDAWAEADDYCYKISVTKDAAGKLVLEQDNTIMYLGINSKGEAHPISFESVPVWSGSDIQYKTIQSWINTFINDAFIEC